MNKEEKRVGCFIDLDGVIWHGGVPFEVSKEALHMLNDNNIPYVFVTNATYSPSSIATKLNTLLDLSISNEQVIVAPSPCINLTHYHNKHVLLCCQSDGYELAEELGFKNYTTIEQLIEIFPEFDYVDHERRKINFDENKIKELQEKFEPVELILLLGEPIKWESALQIIIDLLMTNGDPREDINNNNDADKFNKIPYPHIPVIACNKDLTFKGKAILPRFGHGAFLEGLEHLYKRITKHELKYELILGKPYMSTYKYATHAIEKLNDNRPFDKFYIIGDNPDVDIKGANLYNMLLKKKRTLDPAKRIIDIDSILVCTGVYNPSIDFNEDIESLESQIISKLIKDDKSNDILFNDSDLNKPTIILNNILDASSYIVKNK